MTPGRMADDCMYNTWMYPDWSAEFHSGGDRTLYQHYLREVEQESEDMDASPFREEPPTLRERRNQYNHRRPRFRNQSRRRRRPRLRRFDRRWRRELPTVATRRRKSLSPTRRHRSEFTPKEILELQEFVKKSLNRKRKYRYPRIQDLPEIEENVVDVLMIKGIDTITRKQLRRIIEERNGWKRKSL